MLNSWKYVCLALLTFPALLPAQQTHPVTVIIEDDFSYKDDPWAMDLHDVPAHTALPGRPWTTAYRWGGAAKISAAWAENVLKEAVDMGDEKSSLSISLASRGTYNKPATLRISADIRIRSGDEKHVVGLGFNSNINTSENASDGFVVDQYFTGLMLFKNGTLQLFANKAMVGEAARVMDGSLDAGKWYSLAYDINTKAGSISNITFDGKPVELKSATTTKPFTDTATQYATFLVGSGSRGAMDNFRVTTTEKASGSRAAPHH